nr:MAG TPA: hypothetical protein [Caudoviricetes sp.]
MVIWMPLSFVPTLRRGLRDIDRLSIIRRFSDRTGLSVTGSVSLLILPASYRFVYRQFSDHFRFATMSIPRLSPLNPSAEGLLFI